MYLAAMLCGGLTLSAPVASEELQESEKLKAVIAPTGMNSDYMAGVGLTAGEPFMAPEDVKDGIHSPRGAVLYRSDELVIEIYEDGPVTFVFEEPFPHDEFVQILSGKSILTDTNGVKHEYSAGESMVVPNGFTGTWEMLGNYRGLLAINRAAYDKAYGIAAE
jgi:uncharacterized cupin superfamily protein